MAHSEGIRGVARGVGFRDTWHSRKVSGGWLSVWAFGTRGTLGRYPEGGSRCGLLGHVALSEGIRRVALDVGFPDTWHSRKVSGGWLSVWASGARGTRGKYTGKRLGVGDRGAG